MNDEIKKILENIRKIIKSNRESDFNRIIYDCDSIERVLDYITNLQQENEILEKQLEYLRTDEYLNQVKWERNFNETMNKELKTRIEKARNQMQLIRDLGFDFDGFNDVENLKLLIDELVRIAGKSIDILNGKE